MGSVQVEVLSYSINNVVMKLPDRKFPGVLIQGDSLKILQGLAEAIVQACERGEFEESTDLAVELCEALTSRVAIFEAAMHEHGIDLPYPSSSDTKL